MLPQYLQVHRSRLFSTLKKGPFLCNIDNYKHRKFWNFKKQFNKEKKIEFVDDDIFCGENFLDLAELLELSSDDMTIIFSFDDAQLYQNKKSDT